MKYVFFIIFCSIASIAKAQSIDELIAQTNEYLVVYDDTLCFHSMWSNCPEYYSLKDFNFTKEELEDINIENDSIENWAVISIFQNRILENIDKIAHHKDFPQKGSEFFLTSPDDKLFNFKLFENTGGTHKSYISVMYYKEDGKVIYDGSNSEKSSDEEENHNEEDII
ncbi:MAG: hypothetical protein FWD66_10055 [Paludibacter sp.]|nr:hypothetical protein [Paludibacter sp.]